MQAAAVQCNVEKSWIISKKVTASPDSKSTVAVEYQWSIPVPLFRMPRYRTVPDMATVGTLTLGRARYEVYKYKWHRFRYGT